MASKGEKLSDFKVAAPGKPGAAAKTFADLLSGKGKGGEPEAAEESDEPMEAPTQEEVAAFKELQSAFTKGDPTAGAMALKNFLMECGVYNA